MTISNIIITIPTQVFSYTRRIDSNSINKFTFLLSFESWEDVFLEENVNMIFNNFLNTYLRIFYASFPLTKIQNPFKSRLWLTNGIRISCANKRKLYLMHRNSNDPIHKEYYKKYCKILNMVILAAKKLHYNKLLLKSNNKTKTTWNIVKTITNHKNISNTIKTMNINDENNSNPLVIADFFNNYFSSVAENLIAKNFLETNTTNKMNPMTCLCTKLKKLFIH
jgi:hypothetical protein